MRGGVFFLRQMALWLCGFLDFFCYGRGFGVCVCEVPYVLLTHQCVGILVFEVCWRLEGFWGAGMWLRRGRVASRRVEDVFVVVVASGRWMGLVDRILTSARVYIARHVPLSHGLQVNVLSFYRARHKQLTARFFNQGQQQ